MHFSHFSRMIWAPRPLPRLALALAGMALAGCPVLSGLACAQPMQASAQVAPDTGTLNAFNLIGWQGVKAQSSGQLRLTPDGLVFEQDHAVHPIAFARILSFAIERTNKGLMHGTAGGMAPFAPQGGGQLYSLVRLSAESLSLLYTDEHGGLHAAVVLLPGNSGERMQQAFARVHLQPSAVLTPGKAEAAAPLGAGEPLGENPEPAAGATIKVLFPQVWVQPMPAAYAAQVYEQLVAQLVASRRFAAVWRDGDFRADTGSTLATDITHVRKGSARVRGAIPVAGMFLGKTLIEGRLRVKDAQGRLMLDKTVKGSKSMPGENSGASKAFAKKAVHVMLAPQAGS